MRNQYTSGAHGQNMWCSCAFHPTHWHGVPRIFLTAPLSYAAETYAALHKKSFLGGVFTGKTGLSGLEKTSE